MPESLDNMVYSLSVTTDLYIAPSYWVTNISNRSPLADDTFTYDLMFPASQGWYGLLAWKNGALSISLLWTSMLVMIFDWPLCLPSLESSIPSQLVSVLSRYSFGSNVPARHCAGNSGSNGCSSLLVLC